MRLHAILGTALGATLVVTLLGACSEAPQTASKRKADVEPWVGTADASNAYTDPGWKRGDQASWEQQIRTRAQGQNEYSRASP